MTKSGRQRRAIRSRWFDYAFVAFHSITLGLIVRRGAWPSAALRRRPVVRFVGDHHKVDVACRPILSSRTVDEGRTVVGERRQSVA
jgi:hypothetical protein